MAMAAFSLLFVVVVVFLFVLPHHRISATVLEYRMKEELPVGSVVGNIRQDVATRREYPDAVLSRLRYRFQQPCSPHLRLDNITGLIRIESAVDRDSLCHHDDDGDDGCVIECDVIIESVEFYDVVRVVYVIVDVNDNAPRFPVDSKRLEVSESAAVGTPVVRLPTADDADGAGAFGVKGYTMYGADGEEEEEEEDTFELRYSEQSDTLLLVLKRSLDRERVAGYALRVVAADGGSPAMTAELDVDVVVKDANDNPPRLENENYEATLDENLPVGTRILQVRADDPDEGRNAELAFAFADDTRRSYGDVFGIGPDGWLHVTGTVDYERDRSLVLTVVVSDRGVTALTSYAKVAIYVSDANDNDPVIKVSSFQDRRAAEIRENQPPGSLVAHIVATDSDGGDNGRVTCDIDNPRFRLTTIADEQSEYQLVSADVFDREDRSLETVAMSCRDHGHPPRSATVTIDAWIVDENDNDPKFLLPLPIPLDGSSSSVKIRVRENNAIGDRLTVFNVTDPDDGLNAELDFTVVEAVGPLPARTGDSVFVDRRGVVTAATVFDFEARQVHSCVVVATDRGVPPRSSRVRLEILVEDANDERPTFEANTYVFRTRENLAPGTLVGKVRAFDKDLSPNFRLIFYSLVEEEEEQEDQTHLSIGAISGEITIARSIDRENQSSIKAKVRASNDPDFRSTGTGSGAADVVLYVEDENDNPPVMTFPNSVNSTVTLRDEVKVGDRVARIDAFDRDEGANADLTFSVNETAENAARYFGVEPSTGWIVVADGYRRESFFSDMEEVRLTVHVTDQGRPPRSSTGTIVLLPGGTDDAEATLGWRRSTGGTGAAAAGSWTLVAVGVGCGTLGIATVLVVVVVCFRTHRSEVKNRRSYNCRLEANRATGPGFTGGLTKYTKCGGGGRGDGTAAAPPVDEFSRCKTTRGTGKRGVRFNLGPESRPFISPPITDCKLSCPFPNECIFHRHGSQNSTDYSSPSSSCSLQDPICAFEADGHLATTKGIMQDRRPCREPFSRYLHHMQQQQQQQRRRQQQQQLFVVPRLPQRILRKVEMPTIDRILFSRNVGHQEVGCVWTASTDPYPAAGRPSSVPEPWLNRSLSDSGQGLSDGEESGVFYPGSQEPFFPAESNV